MSSVKLGPLRPEDSAPLFEWLQDRDYRLDSGGFEFVSRSSHQLWFEKAQLSREFVALGVRSCEDDRLVGMVQLVSLNRLYRHAELRIRLAPNELGKGFGSQATRLLCEYGFQDLNLNRIYLTVRHDNERAIRCYEKVGFQVEGRLREHGYVDGQYLDFVMLGLLKSDLV